MIKYDTKLTSFLCKTMFLLLFFKSFWIEIWDAYVKELKFVFNLLSLAFIQPKYGKKFISCFERFINPLQKLFN